MRNKEALVLFMYKPAQWNLLYLLNVYWIRGWVKAQDAYDQLLVYWKVLVSRNSLEAMFDF